MKVSISKALKNVASEKYDKKNIFLFFVIFFISSITILFLPEEFRNQQLLKTMSPEQVLALYTSQRTITVFIFALIIGLITNGTYLVATNNAIHNKEGVFPNPIKEVGNLMLKSLLYTIGSSTVVFLITIIALILTMTLSLINPWCMLITIPFIILMVHAWLCVNFRFYITLKFGDLFSFKKSWIMIAKNIRRFGSYIGKSLALIIVYIFLGMIISMLTAGLSIGILMITKDAKIAEMMLMSIGTIFTALLGCFFCTYLVDLNGQLLGPIVAENKEEFIDDEEEE